MDVLLLLDALENIVEKAGGIPLSGKIVVNKDELIDIIKDIRIKLPDEIKQAQWIREERQKILSDAKKEADGISKEYDEKLSEIELEKQKILNGARKEAENLKKEYEDNVQRIREERHRILAEAEKEGALKLQEADKKIQSKIDESEIVKKANDQCREIIGSAQQDAKKIRLGARSYADDILAELEKQTSKIIDTIKSNRDELKNYKS